MVCSNGPEHGIGESVVEALVLLPGQIDRGEIDRTLGLDAGQRRRRRVGNGAAPAKPQAAALLHKTVESDRQSAGLLTGRGKWHAVGNHDQAIHEASNGPADNDGCGREDKGFATITEWNGGIGAKLAVVENKLRQLNPTSEANVGNARVFP